MKWLEYNIIKEKTICVKDKALSHGKKYYISHFTYDLVMGVLSELL
jgi:hypothetical protein